MIRLFETQQLEWADRISHLLQGNFRTQHACYVAATTHSGAGPTGHDPPHCCHVATRGA